MRSLLAFVVSSLALSSPLHAQDYDAPKAPVIEEPPSVEVDITAQVRLREEVHRGTFSPADPTGGTKYDLTHLRNRASITVSKGNLSAVFEAQDTRWLGEAGTTADSEGMDLRRGAVKVSELAASKSWLEAGRMVLAYGDQRLVGHLEWVNQARTFDGGRLRIVPSDSAWVDVFWTVTRETKDAHDDQYFGGAYGHLSPTDGLTSEFYGLALVDRMETAGEMDTGKSTYVTAGTRQHWSQDGLDARLEGAVQAGTLHGESLLAFGVVAKIGYTAAVEVKPSLSLEAVYGSGDSDPADGDQATFQTLFPTNHLYYGYADQAAWSNLTSVAVRAGLVPHKKLDLKVAYHHFRLSDPAGGWYHATGKAIRAGSTTASSHLGDEVDVVGTFGWREGLKLQCGYGLFLPGAFAEDTGTNEIAHFGYLQLMAAIK